MDDGSQRVQTLGIVKKKKKATQLSMIKFSSWYRIDTEDLSRKISLNVLRITIATFALSFVLFEKHLSPPFFLIPLRSFFFFFLLRLRFFVHVRRVCFVLVRCSSLPCLSVHPPFYSWAVNYFSLHPPSPPPRSVSIDSIACFYFHPVDELSGRHLNKEAIYQCSDAWNRCCRPADMSEICSKTCGTGTTSFPCWRFSRASIS